MKALAAGHDAEVWEVESGHRLHRRCVEENLGLSEAAVKELLGPELRRQLQRDRRRRWGEAVVELAAALGALVIGGLFWGLIPLVVVLSLLSDDGNDPALVKAPASKLEILEQRLIESDGSDFYVALVRNPSRTRSAVQVAPKGAFLDEFGDAIAWPDRPVDTDNRPSLAPGQVGVVWDWLDSYESVADDVERYRVRFVANRWVTGRRRSPIGVSRLRLRRPSCLVTATIRSAWRRIDAELAFIVRNRRGRITGAGTRVAGPLPRGRSRRIVERIPPRPCLRGRFELKAYPSLSESDLTRKGRSGPRARRSGGDG